MLELLTIVNWFTVFALCRCSERVCVPSLLIWTFCGWQNVSCAHRGVFAVLGVHVGGWPVVIPVEVKAVQQQQGFQNWRMRLNFSALELLLEAFCVSCWEYLQHSLKWGLSSQLCSPEWVQPQSKMPQEQQRALAAAAAAGRGAQIDPPVPSVPLGCTEII